MARSKKETSKSRKSKSSKNKIRIDETKPISTEFYGISLTNLKPIMVDTGWLSKFSISGAGSREVDNSWSELIISLFWMVYKNEPDKFTNNLATHTVLSENVNICTEVVRYPEISEINYEVYRITGSNYLVELRRDGADYIKALKGLCGILGINKKQMLFDIHPLKKILEDNNSIELNMNNTNVTQESVTKALDEMIRERNLNVNVTAITVFGYKQPTKTTVQALILFMTWAEASYGDTLINAGKKLSTDGIGVTTAANIDEYNIGYTTAKIGENYLYAASDNTTIIKFLYNIALNVGIMPSLIELEYKVFKVT